MIRCLLSKNVPTRGLSRFLSEEAIKWLFYFILTTILNLIFSDGCRSSMKLSELFMTLYVPSATWLLMTASFMEEVLPILAVQ